MPQRPPVEDELERSKTQPTPASDSHKPAKHIEETARLASSVETVKNPDKIRRVRD
jgi:hypothetical protein